MSHQTSERVRIKMNRTRTKAILCFGTSGLVAGLVLLLIATHIESRDLWYSASEYWVRPTFLHSVFASLLGFLAASVGATIAVHEGWISNPIRRSASRVLAALAIIGVSLPTAFILGDSVQLFPASTIMAGVLLALGISCALWTLTSVWSTATACCIFLSVLIGPNIALIIGSSPIHFAYPLTLMLVLACVGSWLVTAVKEG